MPFALARCRRVSIDELEVAVLDRSVRTTREQPLAVFHVGPSSKRIYSIYKPRRGLNDISVLSKSCHGHSLTLGKAVVW